MLRYEKAAPTASSLEEFAGAARVTPPFLAGHVCCTRGARGVKSEGPESWSHRGLLVSSGCGTDKTWFELITEPREHQPSSCDPVVARSDNQRARLPQNRYRWEGSEKTERAVVIAARDPHKAMAGMSAPKDAPSETSPPAGDALGCLTKGRTGSYP